MEKINKTSGTQSFQPGQPAEKKSKGSDLMGAVLALSMLSELKGLQSGASGLKDGPQPPANPSTPANSWTPPQPSPPWDQMTTDQQIAYLNKCISSAEKEISYLKNRITEDECMYPAPPDIWRDINACKQQETSVNNYIGSCKGLITYLENPPAPPPSYNPFSGYNFHMPHFNVEDVSDLTPSQMENIELALALVLSELEEIVGLAGKGKNDLETRVANANVAITQVSLEESLATLKKVEAAISAQKHESLFEKIFADVLGAIFTLLAAATGNFALAAIMGSMTVLSATGAMDKITGAISTGLQDLGVSKKVANILAAVVIVILVIAISVASGGAQAAETPEEIAELTSKTASRTAVQSEGIEMQNMAELDQETSSETQQTAKSKSFLSPSARLGIMGGVQAFQSTNFTATLTPLLNHLSSKDKAIVEGVIQAISALLSLILGGCAMSGFAAESTFSNWKNTVQQGLSFLAKAFMAASAATQIATAQTTLAQGNAEEILNGTRAFQTFFEQLLRSITATTTSDTKSLGATLGAQANDLASLIQADAQMGVKVAEILAGNA